MRKRRKAAINETTPDIPFQKVRVEWVDCVSDSGWANDKEFNKMKLATPVMRVGCIPKIKIQLNYLHLTTKMKMVLLLGIER